MNLFKTILFFLIVFLILFCIQYLIPDKGIPLTPGFTLRYPSLNELVNRQKKPYKDISFIVETSRKDRILNLFEVFNKLRGTREILHLAAYDTIYVKEVDSLRPARPDYYDNYHYIQQPLEFPEENQESLAPLFQSLAGLKDARKLIRILHYGDSQIEGDRITSYIRNEMQKKFGGSGIGLIPVAIKTEYTVSVVHEISDNWTHYSIQNSKSNSNNGKYGVLQGFSRFSPLDFSQNNDVRIHESWIKVYATNRAYRLASKFENLKIYYGFNRRPLIIQLLSNESLLDADILLPSGNVNIYEWEPGQPQGTYTFTFKGEHSPDIYALGIDGEQGVAVDNIPLRGSSGTNFTRNHFEFLQQMFQLLQVRCIILQFGVNVVPGELKNYNFYEKNLYRQLQFFKRMDRELSIIVMGVSDMSKKEDNIYVSYNNIERIRNAQKNAAFRAGCAFWDTYEAMGGENSMPAWVFHDPPLAQKDFTHFTYQGSKIIAKMFFEALMKEYENYLIRQNQANTNE